MSQAKQPQSSEPDHDYDIDLDIHPEWTVKENNLDESEYSWEECKRVYEPPYIIWERTGLTCLHGMDKRLHMKVGGWRIQIKEHENIEGSWEAKAIPMIGDYTWDAGSRRLVHWASLEEAIEEAEAAIELIECTPEGWIATKPSVVGKHRWMKLDKSRSLEICQRDRNMNDYRYYDLHMTESPFADRFREKRTKLNTDKQRRDGIIDLSLETMNRLANGQEVPAEQ